MITSTNTSRQPTATTHYEQHRGYVLRVLGRHCRWLDPSDREALLHDAYLVFLDKERRGSLDTTAMRDSQIRAYLTQTALHKALDESKRAGRTRSVPLEADDPEVDRVSTEPPLDEQAIATEDRARVRAAVAQLPERRSRVVALRYLLDFTPEEIQQQLGIGRRIYRRELERGKRAVGQTLTSTPL